MMQLLREIWERPDLNFIKHLLRKQGSRVQKISEMQVQNFTENDPVFLSGASGAGCSAAIYFHGCLLRK